MWRTLAIATGIICALAFSAEAQPRGRGHDWHQVERNRGWNPPRGYGERNFRTDPLGSIAGGIIGGVIGSWFKPTPPVVYVQPRAELQPWSREWYAYCSNRYRSFDPRSGYYISYGGGAVFCR
jgi:hypothetical protein